MANFNQIIRRSSSLLDTSGAEHPITAPMPFGRQTGGVYVQAVEDDISSLVSGRITLGLMGALIIGSVGFYYYTRSIQGGG